MLPGFFCIKIESCNASELLSAAVLSATTVITDSLCSNLFTIAIDVAKIAIETDMTNPTEIFKVLNTFVPY